MRPVLPAEGFAAAGPRKSTPSCVPWTCSCAGGLVLGTHASLLRPCPSHSRHGVIYRLAGLTVRVCPAEGHGSDLVPRPARCTLPRRCSTLATSHCSATRLVGSHVSALTAAGGLEVWDRRQGGAAPAQRSPPSWGMTGCPPVRGFTVRAERLRQLLLCAHTLTQRGLLLPPHFLRPRCLNVDALASPPCRGLLQAAGRWVAGGLQARAAVSRRPTVAPGALRRRSSRWQAGGWLAGSRRGRRSAGGLHSRRGRTGGGSAGGRLVGGWQAPGMGGDWQEAHSRAGGAQEAERQINCVAVHASRPHLAASGAAAGSVAVWDLRFAARPAHATLPGDAGEVCEVRRCALHARPRRCMHAVRWRVQPRPLACTHVQHICAYALLGRRLECGSGSTKGVLESQLNALPMLL